MTDSMHNEIEAEAPAKRAWRAPELAHFGPLRVMTQAGTGMQSESDGGSASGMTCTYRYKVHQNCPVP